MKLITPSSPYIHSGVRVTSIMAQVLLALVPAIIAYTWFFGWGLIINGMLAIITALCTEALMLKWRQRPITPFITDGSAVVTAILLAFCIPPLSPWWITVMGAAFAIIVAKHLYGGLGYNPFNPAMVGYVMLLISFPLEMTHWLSAYRLDDLGVGFTETLQIIFQGVYPPLLSMDVISAATALDVIKTGLGLNQTVSEIISASRLFGDFAGAGWEWVGNWILLGGVWLIFKRIISWHIPIALMGSLFTIALFFFLLDPDSHPSPMFHIFGGATLLGAFFIATDPVSAATTPLGKIIYGAGIGILTYVIRTWGGYPDGVAFAVLLMNMAAPTIDYYTQPRVFGHQHGGHHHKEDD